MGGDEVIAAEFLQFIFRLAPGLLPFLLLEWLLQRPIKPRPMALWWPRVFFLLFLQAGVAVFFMLGLNSLFLFHFAYPAGLHRFWAGLPPLVSGTCAFLIFTFIHYWTHIARHRIGPLWRWCHQMHHSAERFGTFTSRYVHPAEAIFLRISIPAPMILIGFDGNTLAALGAFYVLVNGWTHMNIRSPQWLGYFIFRPEQHSIHHAGKQCNFGVIPLWDAIFGTFQNPAEHPDRIGLLSETPNFWAHMIGRPARDLDGHHNPENALLRNRRFQLHPEEQLPQ